MERIDRQAAKEALLNLTPGWARVGLTMPDASMRERAAETIIDTLAQRLESPQLQHDPNQFCFKI